MAEESMLLRPDEVARELALSPSKVYQMLAANQLPAIHIGTAVRVPRDELRAWIRQRQREEQGDRFGLAVVGGTR